MGRRVRHVRRAVRLELLAQDRYDLLAEQVELLQDRLERQPGVVQQEQLALVVTGVLPERERLLDDLLREPTVSGVWSVKSSREGPWP